MKILITLLFALILSALGIFLFEGSVQYFCQAGMFVTVGISLVVLASGVADA